MMDLKTLRELVKLMVNNDLTALDLQDKTEQVSLKRGHGYGHGGEPTVQYVAAPGAPAVPAVASGGTAAAGGGGGAGASDSDADLVAIRSPMVGTFYAAPNPDAPPFVSVGGRVGDDTLVCVIEAMKVFNEIKAETGGTIAKILVENGEAVEFDQPLFMIKPN